MKGEMDRKNDLFQISVFRRITKVINARSHGAGFTQAHHIPGRRALEGAWPICVLSKQKCDALGSNIGVAVLILSRTYICMHWQSMVYKRQVTVLFLN